MRAQDVLRGGVRTGSLADENKELWRLAEDEHIRTTEELLIRIRILHLAKVGATNDDTSFECIEPRLSLPFQKLKTHRSNHATTTGCCCTERLSQKC